MAVTFKECKVKSNKFNKEFTVETYESDGCIVISATSLKRIYEEIKLSQGITDSIVSDVRNDASGKIFYASVELTLRDKDGYCSTSIGEVTPESLTNDVSKKYPKITAYNRALSTAVISYLQLPGKYYSEYCFGTDDERKVETVAKTISETPKVSKTTTPKVKENTPNVISTTPEMPADAAVQSNETDKEAEIKAMEEALPFNDGPTELLNESKEAESLKTEETKTESETIPDSAPVVSVPTPVPSPTPMPEEPAITITEDMFVGVGKYAQTTIADFRDLISKGDALATRALDLIKSGKLNDVSHKDVINYIKNNL